MMIRYTGRLFLTVVRDMGSIAVFGVISVSKSIYPDFSPAKISRHIYEIGIKCIPLIAIVGFFTGMVLGLQGYTTLVRFGSEGLLGSAVALTLVREMGPVLSALLIVGQAGSGLAAEIGIQRNSEQIDALQTMGINPRTFLVGPRILAALIVFPVMTTLFDILGIWGGYFTGVVVMGADGGNYWSNVKGNLLWADIFGGYVKAVFFGGLTILICCYEGFFTHVKAKSFGARGVSLSATNAVVLSSITILVADYFITSFLL
jgi:phospholipid/cholesterol/gamma-HCH transport system permease protein